MVEPNPPSGLLLTEPEIQALAHEPAFCARLVAESPHVAEQINNRVSEAIRTHLQSGTEFDGRNVEDEVDAETLDRLFRVIAEQWHFLGETKPHFSVLSIDEWSPANMAAPGKLAEFYNTGVTEANEFIRICQRNSIGFAPDTHCIELGCGVGRVTVHLARLFSKVTGLDVSAGNLREANKALALLNTTNAVTRLIQSPQEFASLGSYGVFFSRMVLQHNPPPIQTYIIGQMLTQLATGGIGYFQTITGGRNYRYSAAHHLANHRANDFELHALPMNKVLSLIRDNGCDLVDVYRDLAGGYNVESYSFLVAKT